MNKEKKFLLFLFLGALLIRMIFLLEMLDSPYFAAPYLDELYHLNWAREVAEGNWIGGDAFFRAPLYSYFLGMFIRIFGLNFFFIRLAQHLAGAGAAIAIYFLARRVFSIREARIAGILAACYAPFFFFEGEMLDIFLQFLFYPLILILALRTLEVQSIKNNLLLGLVIGISAIARPTILIFLPCLLLFLIICWLKKRDGAGDLVFRFLFLFVGFILPILPVTLHNYKAGRAFVPIASYGGINYYIGNNPDADGYTSKTPRRMYYFGRYRDSVEMFAKEEAEFHLGRKDLTAAEISQYWYGRANQWILENPGKWMTLMLKKAVLLMNNYEIKNNKNIYFVTRYAPLLRFFLSFLPFALVGSTGLLGLLFAIVLRGGRKDVLLMLFFLAYGFGVILFFVSARFRVPLVTALIPCAAYALTTMWDASGSGKKGLLFGGMGALLVLVLFSFIDWFHVRPENFARDHWSAANCYFEKGKLDLAENHYRKALHLKPDFDDALNNLGEVFYEKGDYLNALNIFQKLVSKHPEYARGLNNLGVCYETIAMYDEAQWYYELALDQHPGHLAARANLAEVLMKKGEMKRARKEYERAIETAPPPIRESLLESDRFQALRD